MAKTIRLLVLAATLAITSTSFAATAIAVDDEAGSRDAGYGLGGGDNMSEATKEAMKNCKQAGNSSCQIVLKFEKGCGAYANSKSYAGVGKGSTKKAAETAALEECGNSACKILVSDCEE